jgi:hypothetical protein
MNQGIDLNLLLVLLIPIYGVIVLLSYPLFKTKKGLKTSGLGIGIIFMIGAFIYNYNHNSNLLAPIIIIMIFGVYIITCKKPK